MNQSTHQFHEIFFCISKCNAMQSHLSTHAMQKKKKKKHWHTQKKTVEDNKKRMNMDTLQIYMQI